MTLPADIARCPGVDWDPFGVEPHCLECARRTEGIRDYMTGAKVVWMDAPSEVPCPDRLEPKK